MTPRWTFVIAYYNEADFLPATLAALAAQTVPFRLVLVDNGSTDGSDAIARAFATPGVEEPPRPPDCCCSAAIASMRMAA